MAYDLAIELYGKCEQLKARRHIKDNGSLRETQALLQILKHEEAGKLAHRLGGLVYRLVHKVV